MSRRVRLYFPSVKPPRCGIAVALATILARSARVSLPVLWSSALLFTPLGQHSVYHYCFYSTYTLWPPAIEAANRFHAPLCDRAAPSHRLFGLLAPT